MMPNYSFSGHSLVLWLFLMFLLMELWDTVQFNLLKNAIFHNQENGIVNVILNSNSLTVENSGGETLDSEKIFGRFYKSSQQTQSTGLGLAIVQSIIEMYEFTIRYEFNGMHRFTIGF